MLYDIVMQPPVVGVVEIFMHYSDTQTYMLSALYAIARPCVCPSHRWIIEKRLKLAL